MLKRPRVTRIALDEPALGIESEMLFRMLCGNDEQIGTQQSHASITSVARTTGMMFLMKD